MSQPKQIAIERLKEIKDNGFSTGTILNPKIEFIPKYVWNLINAAIAEAERRVDKIKYDDGYGIPHYGDEYNNFDDWQEKEGAKL